MRTRQLHKDRESDHGAAKSVPSSTAPRSRLFRRSNRRPGATNQPPAHQPTAYLADVRSDPDRVALFSPAITAIRIATVAISFLLAADRLIAGNTFVIGSAVAIAVHAALRSFRPVRYTNDVSSLTRVVFETALYVTIVVSTGFWESPFSFTLISVIVIASFARGYGFGVRVAVAACLAISIPALQLSELDAGVARAAATWSVLIVLISLIAGYGRNLTGEADRARDNALDRLGRLADANALLSSLHKVAQTLPASLDMNEVLDSTVNRLRGLIEFDTVLVLLFDDTDGHWQIIRQEGCHVPARIETSSLPLGLRRALTEQVVITCNDLGTIDAQGFQDRSGSGLYGTLTARGAIIGLVALEHRERGKFDRRTAGLLNGFVPPLALALDNARWFARLRTVGADEERTRIARDLHDRIGQSLAYLAFELDRLINRYRIGEDLAAGLDHLRDDVRGVIREVRDTLYDLRTDVSEEAGIESTLRDYVDRVRERTGIDIELQVEGTERLPLLQEREMWRITQEAVTNIERHARASAVRIDWRCEDGCSEIRVQDNGIGFQIGKSGRLDSYGMLGMRERAASIGATLEVQSTPGAGTTVICTLGPSKSQSRFSPASRGGTR